MRQLVLPAVIAAYFFTHSAEIVVHATQENPASWHWAAERADIQRRLEQSPGRDLVIVRYSPDHRWGREWVYNRADVDGSQVVWARDMGNVRNLRLLNYFKERSVWLLQVRRESVKIAPYPE